MEGLGIWTPNIGMDGPLDIQYRPDTALIYGLNVPGTFTGKVANRENIGKTREQLYDKWDGEFPYDQVTVVGISNLQRISLTIEYKATACHYGGRYAFQLELGEGKTKGI